MGLASALSTALTGLSAAETTIDVVGNNLANSNTIGFKASDVVFATQFSRTLSLGSAPSSTIPGPGGTNPRQLGQGTMVAAITPNFTQGTVDISSNPTDLAIQGDGFFIVQDSSGEHLYTRNGVFKMNATNQLVTVTGMRVLGFGVDDRFEIQRTELRPIEIPLGSVAVAQATENAYLQGSLPPTGDVADTGEIVQSDVLYDATPVHNPITAATLLTDVRSFDGVAYDPVFDLGSLEYTGSKGGRTTAVKTMQVTATSTVQDLYEFMQETLGIVDLGGGEGGSVTGGQIQFLGNVGLRNAVEIGHTALQLTTAGGTSTVNLPFTSVQSAVGESTVCDFLAYDSLGVPVAVRLTAVLESRDGNSTTYRWFADSADNQPSSGVGISVGTGRISFDAEGKGTPIDPTTVFVDRNDIASVSPLAFDLDFSQVSGLDAPASALAVSYQDGFPPGVLISFVVGEDGVIQGVFDNGVIRDLGQIELARFANAAGLEQRAENMFAEGINSGQAMQGNPGELGLGKIVAGAVELSNTDIGANLIDLILASTMYRGNTRVISTAQQMLDELLALRR
jgi:flagellar hook protein FlgE